MAVKAQFNPSTLKASYNSATGKQIIIGDCPDCIRLTITGINECSGFTWPNPIPNPVDFPHAGDGIYAESTEIDNFYFGVQCNMFSGIFTIDIIYSCEYDDCWVFASKNSWLVSCDNRQMIGVPINNCFTISECWGNPGSGRVAGYGGSITVTENESC